MAEASRRAARPAARGGLPNALFVVAAAERPAPELIGAADEVTINFPWGSLLRGVLALDETVASGIVSLLRPGASLTAFVSITARDGLAVPTLDDAGEADALAARWASNGLGLEEVCPAVAVEIAASGSSWAKRLGAGTAGRPAWKIRLWRDGVVTHMPADDVLWRHG